MKKIRRTWITIRERELVIVKQGETAEEAHTICPVCRSHIHLEPATSSCVPGETVENEKLLKDPTK